MKRINIQPPKEHFRAFGLQQNFPRRWSRVCPFQSFVAARIQSWPDKIHPSYLGGVSDARKEFVGQKQNGRPDSSFGQDARAITFLARLGHGMIALFAVLGQIETGSFDFTRDAQTDNRVDHVGDDDASNDSQHQGNADGF